MTGRRDWRPLEGVTVLDLSRMLPGATATRLLVDLGATVHKVEHPDGDETRHLRPRVGADSSVQHHYLDHGKLSYRVDLKRPEGVALVRELAREADAVIESFRPGVAERLGIGYPQLRAERRQLVYVSLSGYGQEGPRAQFAGHDVNFDALASLSGTAPAKVMHVDVAGGMLAALAIASGVPSARASGEGAHVDLSLLDAALFTGGMPLAAEFGAAELGAAIVTPLDGESPCYRTYRCADGAYLAVGAIEPKFWRNLVGLLGRPEWEGRAGDAALIPDMQQLFATRTRDEWCAVLDVADTCVTPLRESSDLLGDPHLAHRASLTRRDSVEGPLWQVASPFLVLEHADRPAPSDSTKENSHA